LNPIRAAMCETPETSEHTSVKLRMESLVESPVVENQESTSTDEQAAVPSIASRHHSPDSFLTPLTIDELRDSIGPCANESGCRCSDKGFLAIDLKDYLELLDWSARQLAPGKRGTTPDDLPPMLQRLGLRSSTWCELVGNFGKLFCSVAGLPEAVDPLRSHRTHRRFHLRLRTRELLATEA